MNYMRQVAKMLGVPWDENRKRSNEFKISTDNSVYVFFEGGLYFIDNFTKIPRISLDLLRIISGHVDIINLPWKPNPFGAYWTWDTSSACAEVKLFTKTPRDIINYTVGNYFQTKQEAETIGKELMERLLEEYEKA